MRLRPDQFFCVSLLSNTEPRNGTASHQLSATALLPSPDGSRHPLDVYDFAEDDLPDSPGRRSSSRGLWECLIGCRHKVDQQLARRRVEQGLRLYNQHKQQAAVRKWRSALKRIRKRDDKFALLGYLYQAYMDWGKYREALEFAHRQLGLAEEADSPNLRAEAYLNLARAHERLGGLERALAYARHSLYNECDQCRTAGHVHLTVGSVYLELAGFCKALEAFQHAHKIAQGIQDPALELQVYVGLSELFGRLQDADKSARYAAKAYDLSRSLQLGDLNSRHHRAALLQMASALRKQGELGDAQDYCSEATRLALVSGDQATYARSIRIMGDIYRKKSEINKAYRQYESAGMGDRLCQMEAMDGVARCLEALRLQQKICNCRPLEFNTRLLEVATSVGAKLLVRTVRVRLSRIYQSLGDEEQQAVHERLAQCLEEELELQCGACNLPFGLDSDSLEALPCSHILHARCAHDILKRRDKKKKRLCPDCHRSVSSRLYLYCDDPHNMNQHRSTFSLASLSLRASSLTLNSHQATSSV
ncbi:43 kDa receptor-associated protein of the synapse homolog isoform X1 [Zootermopsis nevadensis]|uniref:43 kDa receptor-associated protein of the synapse homolog isoform X1 n=1 Tax=Zootermopsis nevadensis TaxID=136037 RepID=UPI000B8ED1C2|nr:43 kDa receptor-associated protein of the synapse homolog isoform X1 [Zootermopsis nevadensis]